MKMESAQVLGNPSGQLPGPWGGLGARAPWPSAQNFSAADRSFIRKVHDSMSHEALLDVLNDRLRGHLGDTVGCYTMSQLQIEIDEIKESAAPGSGTSTPDDASGWAGLRKMLAKAHRNGLLDRINEEVLMDFAVVFSLSSKQLISLKEIVLGAKKQKGR